jgi:DNA-binding CsgD family transcriptional regulator
MTCLALLLPERAVEHLEAALAIARALHSDWWVGNITASLAMAHLLAGDPRRAATVLSTVTPRDAQPGDVAQRRMLLAWGALDLATGKPEPALQIVERLLATVPGDAPPQPIPELLQLQGEALSALGRFAEAEQALEAALRGAQDRGQAPLHWQIARALGHARRLHRRDAPAQQAYAIARSSAASLAATLDDQEMRQQFLSAMLASMPRAQPRAPGARATQKSGGLTARELEVAALIAEGQTNRQIAERLFVAEGTVRTHVKSVLRKLDLGSRAQIAAWIASRDATPSR